MDGIIAHIDLLRRIKLVELARNNVARHESILAQARDRASMGADTQADVTQANPVCSAPIPPCPKRKMPCAWRTPPIPV